MLKIHSNLVNKGKLTHGVDSQCVANLVYALTKLELTGKEDSLVEDITANLIPVVQIIMSQCNAQVSASPTPASLPYTCLAAPHHCRSLALSACTTALLCPAPTPS